MENNRLRLGVLFNFQSSWMGGIIYVINLVKALNYLEDKDKPEIFVFHTSELNKFLKEFEYPYITFIETEFPSVIKGNLNSWLFRKNVFYDRLINEYALDVLYPARNYPLKNRTKAKLVAWYADLQHKYYPEFFTRLTLIHRNIRIQLMLRNTTDLVVSSEAVKNDFINFYKLRSDLKMHVFHFVSVMDDMQDLDIVNLRKRHKLPESYFIVSNQFHKHKNHKVLLKAMLNLKEKGKKIHIAMTGRFPDASHSPYMQELHTIIDEHQLESQISFLGILPRDEQLFLMKHAQAVLQPSLFEGWSTVIEDAKSLQLPVVAASLPVNIEQLGKTAAYFDPHDDKRLAEILYDYPERNLDDIFYALYDERIREAAEIFLKIISP